MLSIHSNRNSSWFLKVAVLAVCYALLGRLAVLLAIPPGFATAIFPSAGIAVAALLIWGNKLAPGVLLGSLVLNLWLSTSSAGLTIENLTVSFSAACGAVVQALLGAWLVRKLVGFPTTLAKERDIILFMALAGPIACMVNASFGIGSLHLTGLLPATAVPFSWFTWWVGDTIGVLIAAPLMFILFASPRPLWWGRRYAVAIPSLILTFSVVVLFIWVSQWEQERAEYQLKAQAKDRFDKLQTSFSDYLDAVHYLERFISNSENVTQDEFKRFVSYPLSQNPGIHGLSWDPVVEHAQRAEFEQQLDQQAPGTTISERDSFGNQKVSPQKQRYVAVQFVEPYASNKEVLGYDLSSNPTRQHALELARQTKQAVATGRIFLVQQAATKTGFLVLQPVFTEQPAAKLRGYAVGIFRINDVVDTLLSNQPLEGIALTILDLSSQEHDVLFSSEQNLPADFLQYAIFNQSLEMASRKWQVTFWQPPANNGSQKSWQGFAVLAVGLLFTSMLSAFLLAMTGRANQIEALVQRRTAELSGIVTYALDSIISFSDHGIIESINPAALKLTKYQRQQLIGHSIHLILPDLQWHFQTDEAGNSTERAQYGDGWLLDKQQQRIPVGFSVSHFHYNDKTIYTVMLHDLTEREKISRMKDEFIAVVSHELRTPLTSIKGSLGLMQGGVLGDIPEPMQAMLQICVQNTSRLELLINDLLDLHKAELKPEDLHLAPVSVHSLINNALQFNQGYADQYRVQYRHIPDPADDCVVSVDSHKMQQALSNFLSNAVKYSPTGGIVQIQSSRKAQHIRISIRDNGPGIPTEFYPLIFQKFSQADSSDTRRVGGTGLGLAITKTIVELHHGRVGFSSVLNHGSCFYLELPVAPLHS